LRDSGAWVGLPFPPLAFRIARFSDMPVDKMFDPDDEEADR
jgi:hypothetical protein